MSPAGERGFTLLELIVVMAIIGLLVATLPFLRLGGNQRLELDRSTRAMADALRRVQNAAIFHHREEVSGIDVERRSFHPGGGEKPTVLAEGIQIDVTSAREEQLAGAIGGIRFFPDGSSTGGRIALALGSRRSVVDVDWLTGLISVTADAP